MNCKTSVQKINRLKHREKNEWKIQKREMWNTVKKSNMHVVEIPEYEEREHEIEAVFKETEAKNFEKWMMNINLQ